ncbi:hypothetical protein EDEG_01326 [Edhazardia aedis USNM 41457]|uniref:RRM domain-containing protein n=1 Tax=Edhazardia aedis (strain USNM 41457) TaxID=1003232 RepID=J9D9L0_EDHAE|nr:hypothetical protein EDEG_01326 [Edhazardia aedis USNM 41457]|eukprot:EJW04456.1 hypothetical protein EDEG_01326 [Edhazardia aedis USNM 41457]
MHRAAQDFINPINVSDNFDKSELSDIRVIQRNLVYVIGIPQKYADENLLRKHEFFGQFGNIKKFVVNKRLSTLDIQESTASAYITFDTNESAELCIKECDESLIDNNKIIRCTFGTTKYCSFFLNNIDCMNTECMYLHKKALIDDSLTKEEMNFNKHKLHKFQIKNKNVMRVGKRSNFKKLIDLLFKYKSDKIYEVPEFVDFKPVEM